MSHRQVRRLLDSKTTDWLSDRPTADSVTKLDSAKSVVNRYQTLLASNDVDENDGREDCIVGEEEDQDEEEPTVSEYNHSHQTKTKKRKKKKRKDTASDVVVTAHEDEDEFDVVIKSDQLSIDVQSSAPIKKSSPNLMRIEKRHLNSESEKRLLVCRSQQLADRLARMDRKKRNGHRRIDCLLIQSNGRFRHSKLAITMDLEQKDGDICFFAFTHKEEYQKVQEKVIEALESSDPGKLVTLLSLYPAHVELLLQVAEIVRTDDKNVSAELVERTISCFESVFHPRFAVSLGYSRLDYRRNENRPLFVALFAYCNVLSQKGCNRTALEVCKLLWSLDPEGDPLAVLLILDFYALASNQTDFLINLFQVWKNEKKLHLFPNYCYSVAYAYFKKANSSKQVDESLICTADFMIQDALLRFPSLLLALLSKCSVEPDKLVQRCDLFGVDVDQQSPALRQLLVLYADRASGLWSNDRSAILWLERNVHFLIQNLEQKRTVIEENRQLIQKYFSGPTPRNILRHVLLSGFNDSRSRLPLDVVGEKIYAFDPLPPPDAIASYAIQPKKPSAIGESSTLNLFLQSWLPAFNPEEVEADQEAESSGSRLKSSISSLADAMKNLLANMSMPHEISGESD